MDYKKIGLKSGLEIHQQLDTPKLFSGAPSYLRNDEPDYVVKRNLHAVAGESGDVDIAVEHEALLSKDFYYEGYNDTISLVELDEEPPRPINKEALRVGLQIALLLNCEIYPVSQVMRKTVIDGSNTSGFQRTVLIAHDGFVETSFGKVPIETVALEEDSARIIKRDEKSATYRLDRLGIPLVEIATSPALNHPEAIKEAALKIGEVLRACNVKRGIGTIRQDVNVSIKGSERVEIKGFQDPKMFVKTVDMEIERQSFLLNMKKELKNVKAKGLIELTSLLGNAKGELIHKSLKDKKKVFGFVLENANGLIGKEVNGIRLGRDLADYIRAKVGLKGIIHSDENLEEKYSLTEGEIKAVKEDLKVSSKDAFVLALCDSGERVFKFVSDRVEAIKKGELGEVRNALPDGRTEFLRPLPGKARMYPETDLDLLRLDRNFVNEVKKHLPKLRAEIKAELKKKGLSDELINLVLADRALVDEFMVLIKVYSKDANLVGKMITLWRSELASKNKKSFDEVKEILNERVLESILEEVKQGLEKNHVQEVMLNIFEGKSFEEAIKIEKVDDHSIEEEIRKIVKDKPGLRPNAYMGLVMAKFKGKLDAKKAMEIINKIIGS